MILTENTKNFSLNQICISGQCFRMDPADDNSYRIIAGDRCVYASEDNGCIELSCDERERAFWHNYFDLDTDYGKFISAIDKDDSYLLNATASSDGVRLLNQDLWEMIVSFLISQQNNIRRIKKCIGLVCEKYGEKKTDSRGEIYYSMPKPEAFSGLAEDALMECNLGYRSKYVVRTAAAVANGDVDLKYIASLPYPEARAELLKCYGIGAKVADCICLFALHQLDAFPVDTHIKQVIAEHYKEGFPFEQYRGFNGVLQQYIFYYDLNIDK